MMSTSGRTEPQLGRRIRELRRQRGLRQGELARRAQIDETYLSKIENGRQSASPRVLGRLAEVLEVPPDTLLVLAGRLSEELKLRLTAIPATPPAYPTRFVGRAQELRKLHELAPSSRLVTVLGPPGCGKTRLLAEAASQLAREGVAVAWVQVHEGKEVGELEGAVAAAFERGATVVVLDDADLAQGASAELVGRVVTGRSSGTVLASSRTPLGTYGEQLLRLAGLPVPDEHLTGTDALIRPAVLTRLLEIDAVRLFVDRAALAEPGFELTPINVEEVLRICRRVDGIPLALELAALRLRQVSVTDLVFEVDDLLTWLTGNSQGVPGRHASLEEAIRWSFDQLSDETWNIACRLSVIGSPFDLGDAARIAVDQSVAVAPIRNALVELVNCSLLFRQTDSSGRTVYRWPHPVRQYGLRALGTLVDSGEIWRRCMDWCRELVADSTSRARSESDWARLVELTHDWLAAVARMRTEHRLEPSDVEPILHHVSEGWRILMFDNLEAGWELVEELVRESQGTGVARARALRSVGILARVRGDFEKANEHGRVAHELFERNGDEMGQADTLVDLAENAIDVGQADAADGLLRRAEAIYTRLDHDAGLVEVECLLGTLRLSEPDGVGAEAFFRHALRLAVKLYDRRQEAYAKYNLGVLEFLRRRPGEARRWLTESLEGRQRMRNLRGVARVIEVFALVEAAFGHDAIAIELLGAARQYRASQGMLGIPAWLTRLIQDVEQEAAATLGPAAVRHHLGLGAGMLLEEAGRLATDYAATPLPERIEGPLSGPFRRPFAGAAEAEPGGLLALAFPVRVEPDAVVDDLLCFGLPDGGHRGLVIPVFSDRDRLGEALERNESWAELPVLRLRRRDLLSALEPGETLVVDPWTEAEQRITSDG